MGRTAVSADWSLAAGWIQYSTYHQLRALGVRIPADGLGRGGGGDGEEEGDG